MATTAPSSTAYDREARFYFILSCAMAFVLLAAFGFHFAMGRSSFASPVVVHVHAVLAMGWLGIYVLQNWLVASGNVAAHRKLGWIAALWVPAMLVVGVATTVNAVQMGRVPFFFMPQRFLFGDPLTLLCFGALTAAALVMRRRTDWHRRLHLCAMAALMGPGFGRLLPMPFMGYYAFEIAAALGIIFPAIAIAREARAGAVHPAWKFGVGALPVILLASLAFGQSAFGGSVYASVVAGTPGEAIGGLEYGAPPPGM